MQTERIKRDEAGVYRWTYKMSLFKNPHIMVKTAIVLAIAIGIVAVFMFFVQLFDNGFVDAITFTGKLFGIVGGIMLGLLLIGYLLYAAIMGGYYVVDFKMDENELVHAQTAEQAKKAKGIAIATMIAGLLSKRPTTVGVGLNATRTTSTTEFGSVRKVVVRPNRGIIKLIGGGRNEVYADSEDFAFIAGFIRAHVGENVEWIEK